MHVAGRAPRAPGVTDAGDPLPRPQPVAGVEPGDQAGEVAEVVAHPVVAGDRDEQAAPLGAPVGRRVPAVAPAELADLAGWLGLDDIAVEPRGDLAEALTLAVKEADRA